uniref:Crossover junction endonuclease MUS81 n=1 Tax=Leptobrachium leishanense TaxID=445787 RepID=A0A8C5MNM4_9ANUR
MHACGIAQENTCNTTGLEAISSLKKYPLPLRSGKETKILQNFGDGICKMLDQRLEKYYAENGPGAPIHSVPTGSSNTTRERARQRASSPGPQPERVHQGPSPSKKKKKNEGNKVREYVPQRRSGGYAVLLTLYRNSKSSSYKGYMTKVELQREAQPLCDKSFILSDPSNKYTAWSSVSKLIQKDLVIKTHSPARYSLTEKGLELAQRLDSTDRVAGGVDGGLIEVTISSSEDDQDEIDYVYESRDAQNTIVRPVQGRPLQPLQASTSIATKEPGGKNSSGSYQHIPDFILQTGQFNIVLCVDFIETTGGSSHRKQDLVTELTKNGVSFDVRKLHIGDFLWIAQEKVQPKPDTLRGPQPRELVLDYVVERKRMDDLCGSIIDGRFREQKFRLKRCGLRHPIYLVEDHGSAQHLSIPESTLQQAIVNTQVIDEFFIKRTKDVRESAAYLTIMTRYLQRMYLKKTLMSCTKEDDEKFKRELPHHNSQSCILLDFRDFNEGAMKNKAQTIRDVFARQLMQISGLSSDKATAIIEIYSTPASLMVAYEHCVTTEEKEKLLSNVKFGKLQRNLGPVLSRTICQLYCTKGALS